MKEGHKFMKSTYFPGMKIVKVIKVPVACKGAMTCTVLEPKKSNKKK